MRIARSTLMRHGTCATFRFRCFICLSASARHYPHAYARRQKHMRAITTTPKPQQRHFFTLRCKRNKTKPIIEHTATKPCPSIRCNTKLATGAATPVLMPMNNLHSCANNDSALHLLTNLTWHPTSTLNQTATATDHAAETRNAYTNTNYPSRRP